MPESSGDQLMTEALVGREAKFEKTLSLLT
jgi:hypothetical protein